MHILLHSGVSDLDFLLVLNLKGTINCPERVRRTLRLLKAERKFTASIVKSTPSTIGMLKKVKNYVAWCELDKETLTLLLEKRGMVSKRKKITEEYLKNQGFTDFSELSEKILSGSIDGSKLQAKTFFRLSPPKGGFPKPLRRQYSEGGFSGYNPKLKEIIMRMV